MMDPGLVCCTLEVTFPSAPTVPENCEVTVFDYKLYRVRDNLDDRPEAVFYAYRSIFLPLSFGVSYKVGGVIIQLDTGRLSRPCPI